MPKTDNSGSGVEREIRVDFYGRNTAASTTIRGRRQLADAPAGGSKLTITKIYSAKLPSVYERQHPERIAAHKMVAVAIRTGRLAKPLFCMRCLLPRKTEAHHGDYRKPLKVLWLCRPCHSYVHPKTQKNALSKPLFRWPMCATAGEMADAMARVRRDLSPS